MIDYYSALRAPIHQNTSRSALTELGAYYPNVMLVSFNQVIEEFIRRGSQGDAPATTPGILLEHYAIYVHETVHWWQFIASSAGFVQTLSHSAQSQMSAAYLRGMSADFVLSKPLIGQAALDRTASPLGDLLELHMLVNSWLDTEFAICCINTPHKLATIAHEGFFESVGICLYSLYRDALQALHAALPQTKVIVPIEDWEAKFLTLRDARWPNFYYGGDVYLPTLGLQAIAEAQAFFVEMQLNRRAFKRELESASNKGWQTMYLGAFAYFLKATGAKFPEHATDTLINCFLLLCDIAMNPAAGFPNGVADFRGFIEAVHPGFRFMALCEVAAGSPRLVGSMTSPSREVYLESTAFFCERLGWTTPLEVAKRWLETYRRAGVLSSLRRMRTVNDFEAETEHVSLSMPIRFAAARQVGLLEDKLAAPELFCWPGYYAGMDLATDNPAIAMVQNHPAPFAVLREYTVGPIVYLSGSDTLAPEQADIEKFIERYFAVQLAADVLRQTVARKGDYKFNYHWDNPAADVDWWALATRVFESLAGRKLESIKLLDA